MSLAGLALLLGHLAGWLCSGHALLTKTDPRAALGWSAVALLVPLLGPLLYLLFGISRARSRAAAIMRERASRLPAYAAPPPPGAGGDAPLPLHQMERLGRPLTGARLFAGNSVEPLRNGDEAYPAMLAAMEAARERVYLESYIFNEGVWPSRFQRALVRASARGCDVRLLVDGVGALYARGSRLESLRERGVRLARFLPPRLLPPNFMINLRDHRKILVCDGEAFTGGMNIGDHHVLALSGERGVQDLHFRARGPVAAEYLRLFLLDWGFATGDYDERLPALDPTPRGPCFCRPVVDGPEGPVNALNDLVAGVVSSARSVVRMVTPYFLPTREIASALRSAAHRGVDVKVVLPERNNLPFVHWAAERVLPGLLQAGVRFYYQPPPFAHTKLLCVDGCYCQIGSANMDSRSLRLNFELNTEIFDLDFCGAMTAHADSLAARGREIAAEELEARPLARRLLSSACWLFSPYL